MPDRPLASSFLVGIGGISLGNLTAGLILSTAALNGLCGLPVWRWLFFIQGPPAILVGLLFFCVLPESPAQARWLKSHERRLLAARLGARRRPRPSVAIRSDDDVGGAAAAARPASLWEVAPAALLAHDAAQPPVQPGGASASGDCTEPTPPVDVPSQGVRPDALPPLGQPARASTDARPLPFWVGLHRVVFRAETWLFSGIHLLGATSAYVGIFFMPLMVSELLPHWPSWRLALVITAPQLASSLISAKVAWATDRTRGGVAARLALRVRILMVKASLDRTRRGPLSVRRSPSAAWMPFYGSLTATDCACSRWQVCPLAGGIINLLASLLLLYEVRPIASDDEP